MRVYLDTCCLNRPFDDQTQPRIRLESEAILSILTSVISGKTDWVASTVLLAEIQAVRNTERRVRLTALTEWASETVAMTEQIKVRGGQIMRLGMAALDALHLACAEAAVVDVFLSTDDRLVKCARRHGTELRVVVDNPLIWRRGLNL